MAWSAIPYVFLIFLIRHAIPFIMGSQHFHSCFAFLHQPVCNTRQEILALKWIFRQCLLQERRQLPLCSSSIMLLENPQKFMDTMVSSGSCVQLSPSSSV